MPKLSVDEFNHQRISTQLFANEVNADSYYEDFSKALAGDNSVIIYMRIKGAFSSELLTRWNDILNCNVDRLSRIYKFSKYGFNERNIFDLKNTAFHFTNQQLDDIPRVITLDDIRDENFITDYVINIIIDNVNIIPKLDNIKYNLMRVEDAMKLNNISNNIPLYIKLLFNIKISTKLYPIFPDHFKEFNSIINNDYSHINNLLLEVQSMNKDRLENYLSKEIFDEFHKSIITLRDKLVGSGRDIINMMLLEKE